MDPADKARLERARKWLREEGHYITPGLPRLLVEFENYLLKCEAERQARG
jgi:hypothetical protein